MRPFDSRDLDPLHYHLLSLHFILRSVVCENRVPPPELGPNERGVDTEVQDRYVVHGADAGNRSPEHLYAAIEIRPDRKRVQF